MGGLARRATIIDSVKKDADGVILVSAGDDLTGPQVPSAQRVRRAKLILDAYEQLGLDAMGLGELDRQAGVDLARVKTSAMVTRAGVRVGLFSADLDTPAGAQSAIREAKKARAAGAQLVVGLLHGPSFRIKDLLASGAAPIDVAVGSHEPYWEQTVKMVGRTWLVQPMMQGKYLGQLDLHILDGKLAFVDAGGRANVELAIQEAERTIVDVEKRFPPGSPMADYGKKRKRELELVIAARKEQLAALGNGAKITTSWIDNKMVGLGAEIADGPAIASLVKQYKDDIAKSFAAGTPTTDSAGHPTVTGSDGALHAAPGVPTTVPPGYAGTEACRSCHEAAVKFWQKTKHAHAWAALVKDNQHRDPSCVTCHITGNSIALQNVQCEACHGPSAPHIAQPEVKGLTIRDAPESMCTICHKKPQAQEWDYTSFRAAILGKGHGQPIAAKN